MDWSVPPLRLYMLKGSFIIADDGPTMDAKVWSKLPEELIWVVLLFLPAATHFRWQSVSKKWRQVLTSASFRNRVIALASLQSEEERERKPPVVAGVMTPPSAKDDSSSELKVLHIDLTSFVPSWFWKADSYTVEAVAEGLVCISNDSDRGPPVSEPGETRFCVLNPLTRTCKVMPQFEGPFHPHGIDPRVQLQPTPAALTIFSFESEQQRDAGEALVATYDLQAGSGGTVLAAYRSIGGIVCACTDLDRRPMVAMCAGETFLYDDDCQVRVLVPGSGGRLVEAAVLEQPSLALLGLDLAGDIVGRYCNLAVSLVVLRGSLLYVESFRDMFMFVDGVMGVWRLARERLEWEAVARLNVADVKRLTGLGRIRNVRCRVRFTYGVREFLYCSVNVNSMHFTLGLNLDTGEWELVLDEQSPVTKSQLVELRPDVFL